MALKRKFPCRGCRQPAEVKRLKDADRAMCIRCAAREVARLRIYTADDASSRAWQEVNGKADLIPLLIGWLKAVEVRARSARHCLEALSSALPTEVASLARCARLRADWARRYLVQLDPLLSEAIGQAKSGRPLTLLEGGGTETRVHRRPSLCVVPKRLP